MIRRILSLSKRVIKSEALRLGLINRKSFFVNGRAIVLTDIPQSVILKEIASSGYESYENEVVTLIKNYPWKVDCFIDIGANVGFYSILAELYFPPSTRVVAVEPFPKNVEYIKKVKQINRLHFELVEKAVDAVAGLRKAFYYSVAKNSSRLAASASLINSFQGTDGIFNSLPFDTVEVETCTLSALVMPAQGPCLIKLDCEGNELAILNSSSDLLRLEQVDFIIEIMINDSDKHEVFSLMKGFGYQAYLITNAGLVAEDRPLTLPKPAIKNRTLWKNHFFTKRDPGEIKELSLKHYGYWI